MRYVLSEEPKTQSDAFDALERVFGSDEFSADEGLTVLEEVLELESDEARSKFNGLLRKGIIEEA